MNHRVVAIDKYLAPVLHEVFVKDVSRGVIVLQHPRVESGHFLGRLTQPHDSPVIVELHVRWQRLVRLSEHRTSVFEGFPLDAFIALLSLLPPVRQQQPSTDIQYGPHQSINQSINQSIKPLTVDDQW